MDTIAGLVDLICERAASKSRFMIGIAGPPAAGKSTTAEAVAEALRSQGETAVVVPMDGFHYDDAVLDRLGLRSRKGSPPTFDCAGFEVLLTRLRANEPDVAIPVFDRSIELARAGAELISGDVKFLIIEGNYLLLNYAPWSRLKPLFDVTVFLDVPIEELDRRMVARWDFYGRERQSARAWIDGNDMPNIRHVFEHSVAADIRFISA
ncbi:MAG: nucleoside triphosphate hydrolase [Rhizobiaceae bacterium]